MLISMMTLMQPDSGYIVHCDFPETVRYRSVDFYGASWYSLDNMQVYRPGIQPTCSRIKIEETNNGPKMRR
jgi:hypothetical protein